MLTPDEFRAEIRRKHEREFSLHREMAELVEQEIVAKPRSHADAVALVLDMLIVQAYKTHWTVAAVGDLGHPEDMATLTRRMLELAMQSIYVGGDSEESVRIQRANQFIAYLWDNVPDELKRGIPASTAADWQAMADEAGERRVDRSRWGPPFASMFEYAGHRDTYDQDYKFLSALAHGSSETLIQQYSVTPVPVRSTEHVGVLLVYSSRYCLNVVDHWMRLYEPTLYEKFEDIAERLSTWTGAG